MCVNVCAFGAFWLFLRCVLIAKWFKAVVVVVVVVQVVAVVVV